MIPLGPFFSIDAVQENKQHGSCYSAPIRSYQTPVTPVRGHRRKGGGAILSRVKWLSTEQTTWEVLHYQTPVTPVRGHGQQRGGAILSHLSKMAVNKQTWEMLHPLHVSGLRKH